MSLLHCNHYFSELKDQYAGTEQPLEHQPDTPELLKAILLKNPGAFKGPARNQQWKQQQQQQQLPQAGNLAVNSAFNQSSPANYGQGSPGYTRHTPQGSPAQPASARLAVPEDKTRPPQSSPNTGFHDPSLLPQRASVIADSQSRIHEQNRPFNDVSENKMNRTDVQSQNLPEWNERVTRHSKRLKNESEHFNAENASQNQRVGILPEISDYNRPEVHPSHQNVEAVSGKADSASANYQSISNSNAVDKISSIRNFRPHKSHAQPNPSQEPFANSVDQPQRLPPTLQPGRCSLIS